MSQNDDQLLIETSSPKNTFAPIVPPRNGITNTIESMKPSVGTKLEGLLLNSDSDSDFDPRADEQEMHNGSKISNDLFGFEPKNSSGQQMFNSGSFTDGTTNNFTNHSSPPPLCEFASSSKSIEALINFIVLVAPPPKAMTPRRTNMNGNSNLFGDDPFQPITKPFNVSIQHETHSSLSHVSAIKSQIARQQQEFSGLDFSNDSRKGVTKDLSSLSFQSNGFGDDLSDSIDSGLAFPSKTDSSRNPFLAQSESPKKSSKLFHKSSEKMMATRINRYDVFKNEMNGSDVSASPPQQNVKAKTDVNPDLFKDFAIAAFSEFKVDKTSSMIHEFSNKLSDQKNLHNGQHVTKVINDRSL